MCGIVGIVGTSPVNQALYDGWLLNTSDAAEEIEGGGL